MSVITTAGFHKGMFIEFKGEPHQIVEFQHVNPGKGSAFVRTRLKSLKSGRVQEFTFKSGESVREVSIETHEMQYLYKDGSGYVFMDNRSYEQYALPADLIGEFVKYLKPNDVYQVLVHEGEAVGLRFPKKVRLLVTEATEGAKGNTATAATKTVVTETKLTVTVPLFIKKGDTIAIDTETGAYLERA
ncbi:elongation factor P [Patescibacteria group bacterium]|nr:elongation factor P [Patescibacteria group bacterium]MBU1472857.1 elongation factor P [Patescibacteria group bacterium]MBU2459514.1 elongation factor P [Patescibacteria group bacterium]MBU2543963.1 elongation factor P [Patescibacteria group bacterium]